MWEWGMAFRNDVTHSMNLSWPREGAEGKKVKSITGLQNDMHYHVAVSTTLKEEEEDNVQ